MMLQGEVGHCMLGIMLLTGRAAFALDLLIEGIPLAHAILNVHAWQPKQGTQAQSMQKAHHVHIAVEAWSSTICSCL